MVREYKETDLDFIKEVLLEFNTKIDLINNNPFSHIYIYDDGINKGTIIYSVYYERVELDYIYVVNEYRNLGIASKFMECMINNCKNAQNITLEVNINNTEAINLYKKYGFDIVAVREKYYNNGDSAYLMERK